MYTKANNSMMAEKQLIDNIPKRESNYFKDIYTKANSSMVAEKKNKSYRMIDEILNDSKESFLK